MIQDPARPDLQDTTANRTVPLSGERPTEPQFYGRSHDHLTRMTPESPFRSSTGAKRCLRAPSRVTARERRSNQDPFPPVREYRLQTTLR